MVSPRNQSTLTKPFIVGFLLSVGLLLAAVASANETREDRAPTPSVTKTTPSGLRYIDHAVGAGAMPSKGQTAKVHYVGTLLDGTKFDSSRDRAQPFEFKVGANRVIKGFDEGVAGMRVGGKRRVIIPPELGYGKRGARGKIPPNAVLIFELELLEVR